MAKNKKKSNARKPKSARHLRSVPRPPHRTVTVLRNGQVLDALTPDFIRWYGPEDSDPTAALACLSLVRGLLEACGELDPETTATGFTAWAVEETLGTLLDAGADEAGATEYFLESWHAYLHYLDDRGRWTGTAEDYTDAHEILSGGEVPPLPQVEIPELSDAEQASGFSEVELIRRAKSLLEWIGTGKEVTQSGVLRLKDVRAAAGRVGVDVRVSGARTSAADALPGPEEPETEDSEIPVVRTMRDVPFLATLWTVLRELDLVTVSSTSVKRAPRGDLLLHGATADQIAVCEDLVVAFVRATLAQEVMFLNLQDQVAAMVAAVLVAGTTERPVDRARLDEDDLMDGDVLGHLISSVAQRKLDELTSLGLLLPGPDFAVPPVIVQCVATLLGDGLEAPSTPTATGPADSRVYQVKISLRGARPPIWRRVLVPSSLRLDELHLVIQLCFAWDDAHLHTFQSQRGRRFISYAPAGVDLEGTLDEATVALRDVFAEPGTALTYVYDFGDSWEHLIELERILDDDRQDLPICTGGRRAAPVEDSGGVWGWETLLETVNDPTSEDHDELREWLGLEPGESLDGQAFDRESINNRLSVLRG